MYLGLVMLMPFLNVLWHQIDSKEGQLALVVVLVVMTVLPSVFNVYVFKTPGAFLQPWTEIQYFRIVLDHWTDLYPITFYYIGAYIRRNIDIKRFNSFLLFGALLFSVLVCSAFNIWKSYSIPFVNGLWYDWGGIEDTTNAILAFLFLNSFEIKKIRPGMKKMISFISSITFNAYLLSWIPDNVMYPILKDSSLSMNARFAYFIPIILLVIVVSLLLSGILELLMETVLHLVYSRRRIK